MLASVMLASVMLSTILRGASAGRAGLHHVRMHHRAHRGCRQAALEEQPREHERQDAAEE